MRKLSLLATASLAVATLVAPEGAWAQSTSDEESDEIIVTAERREQSLQDVPLAVTAMRGDDLLSAGLSNVEALSSTVPGLNVTQNIGQTRVTLRGIGLDHISLGSESSVAFYQDGVFYARSSAAFASFYDVNRVEVLRGPQGTLYGRNATGGSVSIITQRPTPDFEGYVSATVGDYGAFNTEGAISGPLSESIAGRFSFQTRHHDGYGENIATGSDIDDEESYAARGQLSFDQGPLSVLVAADYYNKDDASNGGHYFGPGLQSAPGVFVTPLGESVGGVVAEDARDLSNARDPFSQVEFYGARVDIGYEINDQLSFRSLTAYRYSSFNSLTDISGSSFDLFPLFNFEDGEQFSQEFQLNISTDRHQAVVGLFYLDDEVYAGSYGPFNGFGDPFYPSGFAQGYWAGGTMETTAAALFAQDTISLTDTLRLTVGGRYSWEEKTIDNVFEFDFSRDYNPSNPVITPFRQESESWSSFTPKVGLEFDFTENVMAYISYSEGFKAGTYDLQGDQLPAVDPESIRAIDFGIKSTELFGGRLQANLAGFYYDYEDMQTGKVTSGSLILENAATSTIYGIEGEFIFRPIEAPLTLFLNASWLHARYNEFISIDPSRPFGDGSTLDPDTGDPAFNLSGSSLPQSPDYTIMLAAEYDFETSAGTFTLHGDSQWVGRTWFAAFNREEASQPAYSIQNAYLSFESADDAWSASLFVRNITDEDVISSAHVGFAPIGAPILGYLLPPRTVGLTLTRNF